MVAKSSWVSITVCLSFIGWCSQGISAPAKPTGDYTLSAPTLRQGGDTIENATEILGLPFTDVGTTIGYADDYEESCPYSGPAPDVVYRYIPAADTEVTIDLCRSDYDTQVFVYDVDLNRIACNDDHYTGPPCGEYVSKIEDCFLLGGEMYYIVVDGYIDSAGDYVLEVFENIPCQLECPPGAMAEGEPPLQDGYVDEFNGGCFSEEYESPMQQLFGDETEELDFCGISGWYGYNSRDYDWLVFIIGVSGTVDVVFQAEQWSVINVIDPLDCELYEVVHAETSEYCSEAITSIVGEAGDLVWIYVHPFMNVPPIGFEGHEYRYFVRFDGIAPNVVPSESRTWGQVKKLYMPRK